MPRTGVGPKTKRLFNGNITSQHIGIDFVDFAIGHFIAHTVGGHPESVVLCCSLITEIGQMYCAK